ncbi:hypothetical protein [Treponema endosymbiont of Eucomonympha sp.]|nr:hypothetical protein [Treponema endosymbiont of Eucomonympha sp.]
MTARQIGAVDRQIDEAVYRLYGLSAEEIKGGGGGRKIPRNPFLSN